MGLIIHFFLYCSIFFMRWIFWTIAFTLFTILVFCGIIPDSAFKWVPVGFAGGFVLYFVLMIILPHEWFDAMLDWANKSNKIGK